MDRFGRNLMDNRVIPIFITLMFLIMGICGCIEKNDTSPNKNNQNVDNDMGSGENLTDEDWDYFVFHHTSGEDLHDLFSSGFSIINNELAYYDPLNSTFLLELNLSNQQTLFQLENISIVMNTNISQYRIILQNFTLSSQILPHRREHQKLLNNYQNLSDVFKSIYNKITGITELTNDSIKLVDISEEMEGLLVEDDANSDIIENQIAIIVNIPDEEWEEWTKDRDWSAIE